MFWSCARINPSGQIVSVHLPTRNSRTSGRFLSPALAVLRQIFRIYVSCRLTVIVDMGVNHADHGNLTISCYFRTPLFSDVPSFSHWRICSSDHSAMAMAGASNCIRSLEYNSDPIRLVVWSTTSFPIIINHEVDSLASILFSHRSRPGGAQGRNPKTFNLFGQYDTKLCYNQCSPGLGFPYPSLPLHSSHKSGHRWSLNTVIHCRGKMASFTQ